MNEQMMRFRNEDFYPPVLAVLKEYVVYPDRICRMPLRCGRDNLKWFNYFIIKIKGKDRVINFSSEYINEIFENGYHDYQLQWFNKERTWIYYPIDLLRKYIELERKN